MTAQTPEAELPEEDIHEAGPPLAEAEAADAADEAGDAESAADAGNGDADAEDAGDDADAGEDESEADGDDDDEDAGEDDGEAAAADDDDAEASDFDNLRLVEALLFASAEPLAPAQLARFLPEETDVTRLLADLEQLYANRGVNLVKRGGRWAFRTAPDLAPRMELESKVVRKLSRVALETLAVIAYHQPVTRAEIEEIRGVALSKGTLDALLEIGWIRPKGRRKTPGRPVTWGTSDSFLDHFGLESLDALPGVEELKAAGLLDARPALTALSDRGMLPAAGEVAPEAVDEEDEDDDSALDEGSERDLLEETFGEDLLPQEVDLAARREAAEASGDEDGTGDDEGEGEDEDGEGDDLAAAGHEDEDDDDEDGGEGEDDEEDSLEAADHDEEDADQDADEAEGDEAFARRQRSTG